MGQKIYEKWLDPVQEMDETFNFEAWRAAHELRLLNIANLAYFASLIPRRLGADATPVEIGADKRFAKKLKSTYLGLMTNQWRCHDAMDEFNSQPVDDLEEFGDLRATAATVVWATWIDDLSHDLRNQCRYISAQLHHRKQYKLANQMTHRLEMELAVVNGLYQKVLVNPTTPPKTQKSSNNPENKSSQAPDSQSS